MSDGKRTHLLRVREPLRDERCLNCAGIRRSALANHVVLFFNLVGVNVVDLLVRVILADPFRRAVVRTGLLYTPTRLADRQGGVRLTHPYNSTFPADILGASGGALRATGAALRVTAAAFGVGSDGNRERQREQA
jgi:hypothetical protein